MTACKYWDAGWCYAPDDVETSASSQSACFDYDFCPYLKSQQPVKYETPMTELEELKAQIKVLEKKLSFLEELEKTKTPCEEAYKDYWGEYPETENRACGGPRWEGFQAGYNAAYEEKVSETAQERGERVHNEMEETIKIHDAYCVVDYQPTPQTPEQVADGLKEAFREAVKQGVVSSSTKQKSLYDVIDDWWNDIFTTGWDDRTCINTLVDEISLWLPTEHETNSYKWNECIRMIREKLR